jgi:hypothetical protein
LLPGLPRPPDSPGSLFLPPSTTPSYSCEPLPGRYFNADPQLDPPPFLPLGWFTDVELAIIVSHFKNRLVDTVQIGSGEPTTVHVPGADLDWTVAPRVELGYRLPSGFGEFAVAYRFFGTDGTGVVQGPDAAELLKSRLSVNVVDLDYASREFLTCQWPYVHMKWRFGLRWADAFFDTQADEPFAAAAVGGRIFETHTSNNFWGIGPHTGLELTRQCEPGLELVGWVDGATLLGRIRQNFFEESTKLGANDQLQTGNTRRSVSQDVPSIRAFFGLSWQPPPCRSVHVSVGYEYEYWWNVGRDSGTTSRGELSDQGVLLRAEINF